MLKKYLNPVEFTGVMIAVVLCTAIMLGAPDSTLIFRYEFLAVQNGEFWRFFTANFTHSNWNHLLLNMSGLILIDYLFQPIIKQWVRISLLSFCILTNVILLHYLIRLDWYVGMSGALHGYILGCAVISWSRAKITNSAILVVVIGKLILEINWEINATTAGMIEANVVEESHLAGAIVGLFFSAIFWIIYTRKKKSAS